MPEIDDGIWRILEYGVHHTYFRLEDLQKNTGLSNDQIHDLGRRKGGLIEEHSSRHPSWCLTATSLSLYVTILDLKEARQQAARAYRLAALAIVVALVGVILSIAVSLGWPWNA